MLRAALVIVAAFAVLQLAGARADVGVLSGTLSSLTQLGSGLAYAAAYFAAVLVAPPLVVAGLAQRLISRRATAPLGFWRSCLNSNVVASSGTSGDT